MGRPLRCVASLLLAIWTIAPTTGQAATWYVTLNYAQTLFADCPGGGGTADCTYLDSGASSVVQNLAGAVTGYLTVNGSGVITDFALHDPAVLPTATYIYGLYAPPITYGNADSPIAFDLTPGNSTALIAGITPDVTNIAISRPAHYECCNPIWASFDSMVFNIPTNIVTNSGTFSAPFSGSTAGEDNFTMGKDFYGFSTAPRDFSPGASRYFTSDVFTTDAPTAAPEPSTSAILGAGLGAIGVARRRWRDRLGA